MIAKKINEQLAKSSKKLSICRSMVAKNENMLKLISKKKNLNVEKNICELSKS